MIAIALVAGIHQIMSVEKDKFYINSDCRRGSHDQEPDKIAQVMQKLQFLAVEGRRVCVTA